MNVSEKEMDGCEEMRCLRDVQLDRASIRESVQFDLPLQVGRTSEHQYRTVRTVERVYIVLVRR
jgi:hypothetical protein